MIRRKNHLFYAIMGICSFFSICLIVINLVHLNRQGLIIDFTALSLFAAIIFQQVAKDRQIGKWVHVINWVVLVLIFIGLAIESNLLFK